MEGFLFDTLSKRLPAAADVLRSFKVRLVCTRWSPMPPPLSLCDSTPLPFTPMRLALSSDHCPPDVALQSELASSGDGAVKVWDMADMGFQATAHVLGSADSEGTAGSQADHDPLSRLASLTGNFPAAAKWITSLPVPTGLKEEVAAKTKCVVRARAQ